MDQFLGESRWFATTLAVEYDDPRDGMKIKDVEIVTENVNNGRRRGSRI